MRLASRTATLALAFAVGGTATLAAQQRPYTEGPVVNVSFVRTNDGQFESYMRYIFGDYAKLMNEYKAAGIILDWGVLTTQTREPGEPDVILTVTYRNMAAFDGLAERTDPIAMRVLRQDMNQGEQAYAQRSAMRKVLGSQLHRVLVPRP